MSTQTNSAKNGGIGFLGLLTILFIGLKLTHYIDWGWKWVLAPLWIPLIPVAFFGLVWLICTIALALIKRHEQKKRAKATAKPIISDLDRRR